MKELRKFLEKEIQSRYLEIYLILCELSKKENIISFSYDHDYLMIRTWVNDYYRIKMIKEVNKC